MITNAVGTSLGEIQFQQSVKTSLENILSELAQLKRRQAEMEKILLNLLPAQFENGEDHNTSQN